MTNTIATYRAPGVCAPYLLHSQLDSTSTSYECLPGPTSRLLQQEEGAFGGGDEGPLSKCAPRMSRPASAASSAPTVRDSDRAKNTARGPSWPKISYGIVPWVRVNDKWFFLTQYGYSAAKCDSKIDPLRGRQKPNETPWKCAARECKEESGLSPAHCIPCTNGHCFILRLTFLS